MALNGSFMSINSFPNGVDRSIGRTVTEARAPPTHRGISLRATPLASSSSSQRPRRNRDAKVNYLAGIYTNASPACTNRSLVFSTEEARSRLPRVYIEPIENGIPSASCATRPCLSSLSTAEAVSSKTKTIGIIDFCF